MIKERENWCLFWQEELEGTDHRRLEMAPLLANYYLVAYASPWAKSVLGDKGEEVVVSLKKMNLEIASLGLFEQADKINKGLREFEEWVLANTPENIDPQEVQAFSIECARFWHETFIKVEAGKPTEGFAQDLGRAMALNPNFALRYSEILSKVGDKEKAEGLLNSIYKAHQGFFLALREV